MPYKGVFYLVEIDLKLHFFDRSNNVSLFRIKVYFFYEILFKNIK